MKEWLIKIALATLAALAPIQAVLVSVGVLIMMDLVTGIAAAYKRGDKISSAIMRRTISKILVYECAVIAAFVLETYLLQGFMPATKIVGGVIGLVEFKSILENSNTIIGGDVFRSILKKLGSENDKSESK